MFVCFSVRFDLDHRNSLFFYKLGRKWMIGVSFVGYEREGQYGVLVSDQQKHYC